MRSASLFRRIPVLRAWFQTPGEAVLRHPGRRFLSAPVPIAPYAREHWEYAWLSLAAYEKTPAGGREARQRLARRQAQLRAAASQANMRVSGGADAAALLAAATRAGPSPEEPLQAAGWTRWGDFPDDGLLRKIEATHLRVEVWEKTNPDIIAVTFGGTVFNNEADWRANLRWFIPGHHDEYTDVVQTFAPAFLARLEQRWANPERRPAAPTLISTGHSLGGGLAQQFAYSIPVNSLARVAKVYAFDPSPVTGFYSVPRRLRNHNKLGLWIDRIYERGEVLALLRSLTSLILRPTARNAAIRGVRYALFRSWNPIAAHSIIDLATKLDSEAQGAATPTTHR